MALHITLNHAETISSPASEYAGNPYPEILENVASKEVLFDLPVHLKNELNWPSLKISEYDLEMKIWDVNWELHKLERWDEENSGASVGSKDPSDYRFGLTDTEIDKYVKLADLFHALTLLRYGSSKLYPYLMKRVDVFPIMLRDLPFHSFIRSKPKRPANGFIVFNTKAYAQHVKKNCEKGMSEISKEIGQQWKLLSEEEQK